jgi:hypothetical protein
MHSMPSALHVLPQNPPAPLQVAQVRTFLDRSRCDSRPWRHKPPSHYYLWQGNAEGENE